MLAPFVGGSCDICHKLGIFVFLIVGVEDVEGIAIRNLDDLAGEGIEPVPGSQLYKGYVPVTRPA